MPLPTYDSPGAGQQSAISCHTKLLWSVVFTSKFMG